MTFPGSPYLPADGFWTEYAAYTITGYYHPDTGQLDTYTPVRIPAVDRRVTWINTGNTRVPELTRVFTALGVSPPPDWRDTCDSLVDSPGFAPGGAGFIGEGGTYNAGANNAALIQQPEPQLPLVDTDYMASVDGTSVVNYYDKTSGAVTSSVTMPWRFRNLGKGTGPGNTFWWPQYPNQLRTLLIERPDTFVSENVYNYLWAKGVGLLMEWTIARQQDNNGLGWMRQIIGHAAMNL